TLRAIPCAVRRERPASSSTSRTTGRSCGPCRRPRPPGDAGPSGTRRPAVGLLEHQDGACDLAGLHRAERLVDVLEPASPRDHLGQPQEAALIEVDVLRHVDLETVRAHAAALDALLAQEDAALELELLADRDHADDRRGAARADALEALLGRFLEPDRLER